MLGTRIRSRHFARRKSVNFVQCRFNGNSLIEKERETKILIKRKANNNSLILLFCVVLIKKLVLRNSPEISWTED